MPTSERYEEIYRMSGLHRDLEPVPGDFRIKKTALDIIMKSIDISNADLGLEIGCGSGFQSALLSAFAKKMVATDLPYYDTESHSLGISVARDLLARLETKNVKVVSCQGGALPFSDNTFDFVFSLSVLEHIGDKDRALKEMFRVLKPDGTVILCVPTFFASLCAFAHMVLYMFRRVLEVVTTKVLRRDMGKKNLLLPKADDASRTPSGILNSFRENHPSFPLPEPHGDYRNIFQELRSQLPWNWLGLVRGCGGRPIGTFAVLFLPYNILEVFSSRLIAYLYERTVSLHCLLGRTMLRYFSYSWCILAKK